MKYILLVVLLLTSQPLYAQKKEVTSPIHSITNLKDKLNTNKNDFATALNSIKNAIETSKNDSEKQIAQINNMIEMMQKQIKEVSPEGELYKQVEQSIVLNQEYSKRYADKALETGIRPEHEEKYNELSKRFKQNTENLTKGKFEMLELKVNIEKKVKALDEDKILIVEFVKANEWEKATVELVKAVNGLKEINDNLNTLTDKMIQNNLDSPSTP